MFEQPVPSYLQLHQSGELKQRGEKLWSIMEHCRLCPRMCSCNRIEGERGVCGAGRELHIAPCHQAFHYPEIARALTRQEYDEAVNQALKAGLTNLDIQGYRSF